jgi:DNA invertase Pin-like site-specific DNA recombinase
MQTFAASYYRVSTQRQGQSGLGLEAQRKAVTEFIKTAPFNLAAEFTEVESGCRKDRPQLLAALELCRRHKGTLLIAKLDRLARNVAFISALLESKVRFVAVDIPEADCTFLQLAAVFGEWEARKASERTTLALAAAKERGKLLGWAMHARKEEQRSAALKGAEANRAKATQHALNTMPIINSLKAVGVESLVGIAAALNERGVPTARGGLWHPTTVRNLVGRHPVLR